MRFEKHIRLVENFVMKILLLLVLKCLIYSKIAGDHIYQSKIQDVSSQKLHLGLNDIDECFEEKCARIKRDSSIREPVDLERSPRHKRAVLRKQNQIYFRRRKKKLLRKSKIRKSLMRRGKFTTTKPFKNTKRYGGGNGKIAHPPGLKYRKGYRFNKFKKTQDVAFGMGADGMAQFKKSAPKKRPPIHVRDYERGRRTRKAFRGRVGERRSPVDADRGRAGVKNRRKGAAGDRDTAKKPKKDYYDESDYNSKLAIDSLPGPTKTRKYSTFGKTTKRKKVSKSLKIEDSEYADSDADNTLLLSDDEQLTDVSSEIEALRSELSDEGPRHRKNASSSEYEQYSYAEDDSAIVKGEITSSKEESPELVTFAPKTTLLGPVNYEQYDLKKLDASMERAFKKRKSKKENAAVLQPDDPLDYLVDGYQDETSYETSSDAEQVKQKGRKSKSKVKKGQEKSNTRSKKGQELRTKASEAQTKAKTKTDTIESSSYDDDLDQYVESSSEKERTTAKSETESKESSSYDDDLDEYAESSSEKERTTAKSETESKDSSSYNDDRDQYLESSSEKKTSKEKLEKESEKSYSHGSFDKHRSKTKFKKRPEESGPNEETEEYYSDEYEGYSNYEETITPKRRIPTSKIIQHSKQDTFYEEYTDTDDDHTNSKPNSKSKKGLNAATGKITSKTRPSSKKGHDKSTYESEEYYSEAESSHEHKNKQKKTASTSKKDSKTVPAKIKSDSKKGHDKSTYESEEYDSEEYSETESSHEHKNKQKKTAVTSKKDSKTVPTKIKSDSKTSRKTSTYESEEYDSKEYSDPGILNKHHSDKITRKKDSIKSKKSTSKKIPSKKDSETSTYESDGYDSEYSNERDEKTPKSIISVPTFIVPTTKKITRGGKITTKKKSKPGKNQETSIYESDGYDSDYSDKHSDKHKDEDFGLDDIKSKKDLKFLPSETMEMKNHQLDVIKSSKDYKLPLKTTLEKKIGKDIKTKTPLSQKTTLKTSSKKTTKNKQKTEKTLVTSYEESNYDSQVTSYEYSSDDASHSKKSLSQQLTSFDKNPAYYIPSESTLTQETTHKKDHQTSYNGSQDIHTQPSHIEDHLEDELMGSHETESTKVLRGKTTSTTKRYKKGFTTLPSTPTKGFDSAEALLKVSSRAAAITKKHMFVYNTKKKAYELVRIHSSQPRGDVGHSAVTQNLQSSSPHSEDTHQPTLSHSSDHTVSNHAVSNETEIPRRTKKSSRKRSNVPESESQLSQSRTTRKRSRKTTEPGSQ